MAGELKITANVAQAQQAIQRLQAQVQGLTTVAAGLGAAITTVFSAAVISRAIQYADAIQDISTATGISVARVTGLTTAFIENGGSAEGAQKAILELSKSIQEAADGSGRTQRAFEDIGISLQDLARLSEQDILARTIQGLSRITDNTKRLALANQLLGKESRLVDFAGVAGSYEAAAAAAAKYQSSQQEVARLQGQLDRAFVTLQSSILKVLEPLARFVNNLKPEQIDRFVEAVVKIGAAAAAITVAASAFTLLGKVIAGIGVVFAATVAYVKVGAGLISSGAELIARNWLTVRNLFSEIFQLWRIGFTSLSGIIGRVGTTFAALAGSAGIVAPALAAIAAGFGKIALVAGGAAAVVYGLYKLFSGNKPEVEQTTQAQKEGADALEKQNEQARQILTNVTALRDRLADVTQEYKRSGQSILDNLRFETEMVGKTEAEIAVARAVRDEKERQRRAQEDLNRQQTELNQKLKSGAITQEEYRQSTAAIRTASGQITAESQRQESSIVRATQALQDRLRAQQLEKMQIQAILDLQEQQLQNRIEVAAYEDQVNAAIQQSAEQVRNLQRQLDLENQRAVLEQSVRFLRKEDQDTARAIFELETRRRDALLEIAKIQNLPYEEQLRREREVNEAVDKSIGSIKTRAEAMRQEQESFATGWGQALEQFRNNVQTQSELAGDIFSKLTKGMEDAFVNFAKTGKLSFKDLMRSIVEMILRSQIQRLIAQLFGAGPTGGNLFTTFLTSLFGGARAQGGPVSNNRAYLVGERGPELFMPRSNGEIIPNAQLGGGATQVTYNINAVDAESFRSLVARDPEFIFAVTEQGRRRMPTPRR